MAVGKRHRRKAVGAASPDSGTHLGSREITRSHWDFQVKMSTCLFLSHRNLKLPWF